MPSIGDQPPKLKSQWPSFIAALGAIAAVAVAYVYMDGKARSGHVRLQDYADGSLAKMTVVNTPEPPPAELFDGPDGAPTTLAAYKGRIVVLNLWATWCAPCVEEMPTLAALQRAYADKPVTVLPLSVDRPDSVDKARAFIAQHAPLTFHHADPGWAFKVRPALAGFPSTIIYDRDGKERARISAKADWSSKEARAVIDALLAEGRGG